MNVLEMTAWVLMILMSGCYKSSGTAKDADTSSEENADATNMDIVVETASDTLDNHAPLPDITWIPITGGTFTMGSPNDEPGRIPNERAHLVTLTHDFEIAATEVTVAQWITLDPKVDKEIPTGNAERGCDAGNCPAYGFYESDAYAWLDELSRRSGFERCYTDGPFETPYHCTGYRLPTEAEWEYAARAGSDAATYSGDLTETTANGVLFPIAYCLQKWGTDPQPVGLREPNAWGLFDTLGNLEEATQWLGTYPADAVINPVFEADAAARIALRGGAVDSHYDACRLAHRGEQGTEFDTRDQPTSVAIRPVRTLPGSDIAPPSQLPTWCENATDIPCPGYGARDTDALITTADLPQVDSFVAMAPTHLDLKYPVDIGVLGLRQTDAGTIPLLAVVLTREWVFPEVLFVATVNDYTGAESDAVPVTLMYDHTDKIFIAVLCTDVCFLATSVATSASPAPFVKIEGSELPSEFTVTSALIDTDGNVIVAGDGIAVFSSGGWYTAVAGNDMPRFNHIAGNDEYIVAAGDNGRLAIYQDGSWFFPDSRIDTDLFAVTVSDTGDAPTFEAVGEDGMFVGGTFDDFASCRLFDADLIHALGVEYREVETIYLGASGEQILRTRPEYGMPPCTTRPLPSPVLQLEGIHCSGYTKYIYLRKEGLYGNYSCPLL